MRWKNLPPLAIGQAYRATEFERFDFAGSALTGSGAILRLQMSNGTTIDLPTSDDELRRLRNILAQAYPT